MPISANKDTFLILQKNYFIIFIQNKNKEKEERKMNDFKEFMKLTKESAELIRQSANIFISDLNTDDYLIEGGYYDYDTDNPIITVLNFIQDYYFDIK